MPALRRTAIGQRSSKPQAHHGKYLSTQNERQCFNTERRIWRKY
jgi:hypothetical protein